MGLRCEVLKRLGRMAEIFENYSPLKLGQTGQIPAEGGSSPQGFTRMGRLQSKERMAGAAGR